MSKYHLPVVTHALALQRDCGEDPVAWCTKQLEKLEMEEMDWENMVRDFADYDARKAIAMAGITARRELVQAALQRAKDKQLPKDPLRRQVGKRRVK